MLHLQASSSLDQLAESLARRMGGKTSDVFRPQYIVTQTEGMNNWLRTQLAEKLGIAANCRFLKPNDLIHQLYYLLDGPEEEALSSRSMTWLLYRVLGGAEFQRRWPMIAGYYLNAGAEHESRRLDLATRMADLFDQYQIYRPAMMRDWNGADVKALGPNDWQQYLWIKGKAACANRLPDKTKIGDYILHALRDGENLGLLQSRMPAVHLFGLSITTEYHVQILNELANCVEVCFYVGNPAPALYWFDEKPERLLAHWRAKGHNPEDTPLVGNALLTSWGRIIQDTFSIFFRQDAFINAYDELLEDVDDEPNTLLQKVQYDIRTSALPDSRQLIARDCLTDGSLSIHSCHTPAREVETLYNYLVHLVDEQQARISPRDIVVMVSDIDEYAPFIKAVFAHAPYRFRYTIADESLAGGDNILEALNAVLSLNEDSFKAEAVMQLLDLQPIRDRFDIQDVTRLRHLVNTANIRFGLDGREDDDTRFVSWRYGLKRIMYGICMAGELHCGGEDEDFYPLDILEGSDARDAVRFCHFAEVLMSNIEARRRMRDIRGWVAFAERTLADLVHERGDELDEDYDSLMSQLAGFNDAAQWMEDELPYAVFLRALSQSLRSISRTTLYTNGGITFCSLIPMRSIPFRVVCMLGLGHDKFPRRDTPASFDIISAKPAKGDRSMKENDKHLFLETVLSASEHLFISYCGRSAKDNTPVPPSALVDELLDYIEEGLEEPCEVRKELVRQHPLQLYSRRYADGSLGLRNYLAGRARSPVNVLSSLAEAPQLPESISLDALAAFFENPLRAYYHHTLGVYYNDEESSLLPESELFGLNKLQQWQFKETLLGKDAAGTQEVHHRAIRGGRLPLSRMADVALVEITDAVEPVKSLWHQCTDGHETKPCPISLTAGSMNINGTLSQVVNERAIMVCWSKRKTKHLLKAYIRLMGGIAAGAVSGGWFISGEDQTIYEVSGLSQEEATERLEKLVACYLRGLQEQLPFCVDFIFERKPANQWDVCSFQDWRAAVEAKLEDFSYPCTDPYVLKAVEDGVFDTEAAHQAYRDVYALAVAPLEESFVPASLVAAQ